MVALNFYTQKRMMKILFLLPIVVAPGASERYPEVHTLKQKFSLIKEPYLLDKTTTRKGKCVGETRFRIQNILLTAHFLVPHTGSLMPSWCGRAGSSRGGECLILQRESVCLLPNRSFYQKKKKRICQPT